jgi:uncharacterized protein (TIGR03067 family)
MKPLGTWLRQRWRGGLITLCATVLVAASYITASEVHRWALRQFDAGKASFARAEWHSAIRCFDRALRIDRSLSEAYLLRGTAVTESINETHKLAAGHSRQDALADIDVFLRERPDSGEGHYQRGIALAGLGEVRLAHSAFGQAITLLADPTEALLERAGLSFHIGDYAAADKEITAVIDRHPLIPAYYDIRARYRRFVPDQRGAHYDRVRAAQLREAATPVTVGTLEALEREAVDYRVISQPQDAPTVIAERGRFLGTWNVVARETRGSPVDTTDRDFTVRFDDDRYSLVLDGTTQQQAPFRVDPTTRPRQIDWMATIQGKEVTLLGIYEFRNDTLVIGMGNQGEARPHEFTTNEYDFISTVTLYILSPSPSHGAKAPPAAGRASRP